jgi:hypothetical protein
MNKKILELIAIVHDNYDHVEQLETLISLLEDKYPQEAMVAKTTQNSHYNYLLYTSKEYQNPDNHVDKHILMQEYYQVTNRSSMPNDLVSEAWKRHLETKKLKEQA